MSRSNQFKEMISSPTSSYLAYEYEVTVGFIKLRIISQLINHAKKYKVLNKNFREQRQLFKILV